MIIGHDFVYAHLPRTGGTAVEDLFRGPFSFLALFQDPRGESVAEIPFCGRSTVLYGRVPLLGFRRLASWYESFIRASLTGWYPFGRSRGRRGNNRSLEIKEEHLHLGAKQPGYWPVALYGEVASVADYYLNTFLFGLSEDKVHWLRCEFLSDDVLSFFRGLSEDQKDRIRAHFKRTAARMRPYEKQLTRKGLSLIRRNNPRWVALEKKLYG